MIVVPFRKPESTIARFPGLCRRRVLAIADAENLTFGLRKTRQELDYRKLATDLGDSAASLTALAIATVKPEVLPHACRFFTSAGWIPKLSAQMEYGDCRGRHLRANADSQILLHTGAMVEKINPEVLVLASGDGDLGCELAIFLEQYPNIELMIFGLRDQTSQRLESATRIARTQILGDEYAVSLQS